MTVITNLTFFVSDIVSGLLCCSAPPYHHQWRPDNNNVAKPGHSGENQASSGHVRDSRTMEWVVESQKMRDQCKLGQCGQDCGDGFCYNVWNNLVHV